MATGAGAMPLALSARERLRDQQQQEARRLAAVLAAQRRLTLEQHKESAVIERARRRVAARRDAFDDTVRALIGTSGVARTAILLERPERDLARLKRANRPAADSRENSGVGESVVPA